jgi:hypothetical protein
LPTRVLRDGILDSERVGDLSVLAELFYRKLMSVVDDYGRFELVLSVLRARLYSQRLDETSEDDIRGWVTECCTGDRPLVKCYSVDGKSYLEIQEFGQQLKAVKSKYPEPNPNGNQEFVHGRIREITEVHSRASPSPPTPTTHSAPREESARETKTTPAVSPGFADWWPAWEAVRGSNHKGPALRAWMSVVTPENEPEVFACTESYLGSIEGHKGYNPENFLFDQARDGFHARWPAKSRGQPDRKSKANAEFWARAIRDQKGIAGV